jgi:hypothetical protein
MRAPAIASGLLFWAEHLETLKKKIRDQKPISPPPPATPSKNLRPGCQLLPVADQRSAGAGSAVETNQPSGLGAVTFIGHDAWKIPLIANGFSR